MGGLERDGADAISQTPAFSPSDITVAGKDARASGSLPMTTRERVGVPQRDAMGGSPTTLDRYVDMLATVLTAEALTKQAMDGDRYARARALEILAPLAQRLSALNDHQGRFSQFGAGNIAGQAQLDMAETAIRSWRQRLTLGAMVRESELVLRFRAGAEAIQFLTGEHRDAPTLRGFNQASATVGVGAAGLVLTPVILALAAEEAVLLAFVGRVTAQQVALWALRHPAAAIAAGEALFSFGVQIGEEGWESFWDQLRDPRGRLFVLAQILMDFMHVKSSMAGPHGEPSAPRQPRDVEPELQAGKRRAAGVRATLQQVHDVAKQTFRSAVPEAEAATVPTSGRSRGVATDGGISKAAAVNELVAEIERSAGGLRRPALETIEAPEMERLRQEFIDLGGDASMLRFNQGAQTGFIDRANVIAVRGDVNPVADSLHPRSAMSSKAVLAHELGHAAHRDTPLAIGAWNDEFRASYWAAKNLPNLSEQDRIHLVLDAMERAKEAGVAIRANAFMRKVLYGY